MVGEEEDWWWRNERGREEDYGRKWFKKIKRKEMKGKKKGKEDRKDRC